MSEPDSSPEAARDAPSESGEQHDRVELPDSVSMDRSMLSLDGEIVDGYLAEFIGITGAGHDEEEALADLFSEIEVVLSDVAALTEEAAATMDGTADDLEAAEETPVEIADRLREDAQDYRRRLDDV